MLWSFLGYAGSAGNLALYDFCCLIRDMFCIGSRWGGGGRGSPRGGGVQYGSMNNSQSSPTSSLPTIFLCCFCSCQTRSKVSYKSMTKWERILCKEPLTIFHLTFFPRKVLGGGGVKLPESAVDHSHRSSAEVTNELSYTSTLPACFFFWRE
jgi:hypothetical protein